MSQREPPEDPGSTELAPTATEPSTSGEPTRMGPYRLLEKLGEGGMGEVWLAQQEHPVRRRVALKLIKLGMDTVQVVARFEAERQALALMDHPAVAKVLDAGVTPAGRPFFVMEHVHGVPITEHCDRHRLTTRERLELFREVCEGVQHAHQKAILHRDLKPSNVLVSEQGGKRLPKIIDFGVAKATAQRLTERTLYTELGVLIGTPEYMSPEQAGRTGEDVDTRTDVYSLGVMLYELLVGALPFEPKELRAVGFEEIRRKIREDEPLRPSARLSTPGDERSTESARRRRVSVPALRRQLRGELDWIVMKALEKDRARRYGSPAELAADLGRHLRNEPVAAGPPSAAYRVRKFVRRHRVAVGFAVAGVVVLASFAGMMAVQAQRIAAERDRATEVLSYLKQVFEVSDPSQARGGQITARELLDRSAARIDEQLADRPELLAEMAATMGQVYFNLGLYEQAGMLLTRALEARRHLLGDRHPDTLASIGDTGTLLQAQGKLAEAEPYLREALEGLDGLLGSDHPSTLTAMNNMAILLHDQGKLDEAEALYRKALEGSRRVHGSDNPDTLKTVNNMAGLLHDQGKLEEAEAYYREALEGDRRTLGADHPGTLTTINTMAGLLHDQGRLAEAESYYREALEGRRRVLGSDHPRTLISINNMGLLLQEQRKLSEAECFFREALEENRRLLGADHPNTSASITNLAGLLHDQGKLSEAEPHYREAVERLRRVLGDDHPDTLTAIANMGFLLQDLGQLEEAEAYSREALEGRRRVLGADHPDTARSLSILAVHLNAQQRFAEAEPLARETLVIERNHRAAGNWRIAWAQGVLGESVAGLGRHAEAEPLLLESRSALEESAESTERHKRMAVERLIALYAAWGRADEESRWRQALAGVEGR